MSLRAAAPAAYNDGMNSIIVPVIVLVGVACFSSNCLAQANAGAAGEEGTTAVSVSRPPPATRVESLLLKKGIVLVRGYTEVATLQAEDGAAIVAETLEESRKVAAAEGHAPADKVLAGIKTMLTSKGSKAVASILGDMEKGGPAEGKQIVGDMLARARKHGIAAPNLRFAYAHLQAYEARRARGGLK